MRSCMFEELERSDCPLFAFANRLRQVERLLSDWALTSNVLAPEDFDWSEALYALRLRSMLTVADDFDPDHGRNTVRSAERQLRY